MKLFLKLTFSITVWIIFATGTNAQEQKNSTTKNPKWISDKGFWQIESNVQTPDRNIVYFYTHENVLIYREHLNGVVLNLNKRSVRMRLKKALESAVQARNNNQGPQNDQQLISMLFQK
jgi:hypothetical protein